MQPLQAPRRLVSIIDRALIDPAIPTQSSGQTIGSVSKYLGSRSLAGLGPASGQKFDRKLRIGSFLVVESGTLSVCLSFFVCFKWVVTIIVLQGNVTMAGQVEGAMLLRE